MVQGNSTLSENHTFNALESNSIELPENIAFADMEMSQEGQDLILQSDNGQQITIDNYFMAEPQPVLEASDGSALTPELVSAFVQSPEQLAQIETAAGTEPVGAIEELHGEATVTRADGSSEPITLGTEIYQGDIVETSADGGVNILFIDETSMALSEGARFAVTDYSFDAQTENGTTNFSVLRGVFVFTSGLIGRDDPDDVNIDTPVGSIGIRGTIIAGHINPEGESSISVVEGAIVIKNGAGERTLSEQFETIQVNGFNSEMQDMGVLEPAAVTQAYGSASYVIPSLFSNINDAAKEKSAAEEAEQQAEEIIEAVEEETKEEVIEEPMDDMLKQKEVIMEKSDASVDTHEMQKEDRKKHDDKKENQKKHNKSERDEDNLTNPDVIVKEDLKFGISSDLTEHEQTNGIAAYLKGAPNGVDFTFANGTKFSDASAGSSHFKIEGNKVILTSSGQSALNSVISVAGTDGFNQDTDFGNYIIKATGPNGTVVTQEFTPIIHDVAMNLHGGGEYNALFGGKTNLGNMNDDANNRDDYALINGGGHVEISDALSLGGLHTTSNAGYTSIAALGDINNDGFDDAIAGKPGHGGSGAVNIIKGTGSVIIDDIMAPPSGVNAGDKYGHSVSSAGDFNGDGNLDYVVGASEHDINHGVNTTTNEGAVYIHAKDIAGVGNNEIKIYSSTAGENLGKHVSGVGDINGDGKSDILIGGEGTGYLILGGRSTDLDVANINASNGLKFNAGTNTIIGGGAAGDFNGDGFDDTIVSVTADDGSNGDAQTYVIFGNAGSSAGADGIIDMNELENPNVAFKINDIAGYDSSSDYIVRSVGDLNGDGFNDIEVGSDSTGFHVVHGQRTSHTDDYLGAPDVNSLSATADDQFLVSAKNFYTDVYEDLSINGDARNNNITVRDENFRNIDGGSNDDVDVISFDTIRYGISDPQDGSGLSGEVSLDFTNITYEQISSIERLQFTQDNDATIRLTVDNIFNLLKTSEDGTLKIENDGAFTTNKNNLIIDANGGPGALTDDPTGIQAALDEGTDAAISHSVNGGFDQYNIGGYTLYIDQNIEVTTV